jgi:hypothetical protein
MEDNFNNRDFEQFVKQNADQYRMFPSEKVWKNIHHTLHTRRRWYGLGLIVLLLTAGIVTWVMLTPSIGNNDSLAYNPETISQSTATEQKNIKPPILIAAENPVNNKTHFISTTDNLQKNLFISTPVNNITGNIENEKNIIASVSSNSNDLVIIATPSGSVELPAKNVVVINKQTIPVKTESNKIFTQLKNSTPLISEIKKEVIPVSEKNNVTEKINADPLKIESVVKTKKQNSFGKKLSWEAFITPTISYRDLSENKDFINSAQANNNIINSPAAGINSLVTHKPDMGLQFGFNAGYPITKNIKITTGLQFNVSKYDIRASFSPGEVATIALNVGTGANSVSTISNYRNTGDSKADWLRNLYFSASVPVGVELKLSGNSKTEFGVSGTIQPTYVLSNKAYLISTDYKNYVEVPSLIRRWNINTGFEIYAGFSTGNLNLRVGPQVRYQLKSSFQEKYPVKEHLFDFGLKLGVMLKK